MDLAKISNRMAVDPEFTNRLMLNPEITLVQEGYLVESQPGSFQIVEGLFRHLAYLSIEPGEWGMD